MKHIPKGVVLKKRSNQTTEMGRQRKRWRQRKRKLGKIRVKCNVKPDPAFRVVWHGEEAGGWATTTSFAKKGVHEINSVPAGGVTCSAYASGSSIVPLTCTPASFTVVAPKQTLVVITSSSSPCPSSSSAQQGVIGTVTGEKTGTAHGAGAIKCGQCYYPAYYVIPNEPPQMEFFFFWINAYGWVLQQSQQNFCTLGTPHWILGKTPTAYGTYTGDTGDVTLSPPN